MSATPEQIKAMFKEEAGELLAEAQEDTKRMLTEFKANVEENVSEEVAKELKKATKKRLEKASFPIRAFVKKPKTSIAVVGAGIAATGALGMKGVNVWGNRKKKRSATQLEAALSSSDCNITGF